MTEPRSNADQTSANGDQTLEPLTVAAAAARLGLSTDAVRMRIRRGTLASTELDGHRVVLLPRSDTDPTRPIDDATTTERDQTTDQREADERELVSQLRSEVTYLRQTLDAEIEARRRADHLVAGMIEERRHLMDQIAALTACEPIETTEQRPNTDQTSANVSERASNTAIAANEGRSEAMPTATTMDMDAARPDGSFWDRFWRALTGR